MEWLFANCHSVECRSTIRHLMQGATTLAIMTLSITTCSKTTLSTTTISITKNATLCITSLSIKFHNAEHHYADCSYGEWRFLLFYWMSLCWVSWCHLMLGMFPQELDIISSSQPTYDLGFTYSLLMYLSMACMIFHAFCNEENDIATDIETRFIDGILQCLNV